MPGPPAKYSTPSDPPMKRCTACHKFKPATTGNFQRNSGKPDGLYHWCKRCCSIRERRFKARRNALKKGLVIGRDLAAVAPGEGMMVKLTELEVFQVEEAARLARRTVSAFIRGMLAEKFGWDIHPPQVLSAICARCKELGLTTCSQMCKAKRGVR